MSDNNITEGMLDMFLFESEQMLEQMEEVTLLCEKQNDFDSDSVNEMFRFMHTIKGSSGIMMLNNIMTVSHRLEDIFGYMRENEVENLPVTELIGYIFEGFDFISGELEKIKSGGEADGDETQLVEDLENFYEKLKRIKDGLEEEPEVPEPVESMEAEQPKVKEPATVDGQAPAFELVNIGEGSKFFLIRIQYRKETEMANLKAYSAVFELQNIAIDMRYEPATITEDEGTSATIIEKGFWIAIHTINSEGEVMSLVDHSAGVSHIDILELTPSEFTECMNSADLQVPTLHFDRDVMEGMVQEEEHKEMKADEIEKKPKSKKAAAKGQTPKAKPVGNANAAKNGKPAATGASHQSFISVNVEKMDMLMDLIGELVIAESVVLQNQDLKVPGLDLTNFNQQAAQMTKLTSELQEAIMSIRMMPLTNVFQKMNRVVYDMTKKLDKDIDLEIIGEGTEVDKNIIEHISDPLMHMIRNAADHGIETREEREQAGKPAKGTITLEAKNEGGKVWIIVKDDGKGLSRKGILKKAREKGLIEKGMEKDYTGKDVYSMITLPGFSTNTEVTEFSGRGVGMDVVMRNIQSIGGSLDIDSDEGFGSTMTLKIPLTLAIIDGIILAVGSSNYVVATEDVKEFVGIKKEQLIVEPDGSEFIMLRGECYPVLRLKKYYNLGFGHDDIEEGIVTLLEYEERFIAVFVDELIGEQEIVVKPIPNYIKKVKGLSGCTQLGDGSISLILDTGSLINS